MSTFRHSSSTIDQFVYQIHGLTALEVALVEQATAPITADPISGED